jgi:potassium-dependent mechanosensitive channel
MRLFLKSSSSFSSRMAHVFRKPTVLPLVAILVAVAAPQHAVAAVFPATHQPAPAATEQKAQAQSGAEQKAHAKLAPATIPVPEIVKRAEEDTKLLHDLEALGVPGPAIEAIQARLPEVNARLGQELDATIETLKHEPARTSADRMKQSWRANRLELGADVDVITKRAIQIENALDQLAGLRVSWTKTREEVQASRAPDAVLQRVDAVMADIKTKHALLDAQRNATLVLQDQVAQEVARCEDALARIDRFQEAGLMRTFTRDSLPIWSPELQGRHFENLPAAASEAVDESIVVLRRFASDHAVRLLLHGLLFIGLVLMARAARQRAQSLAAGEKSLPDSPLFTHPHSSAVLVALVAIIWFYPERPRLIGDVATVLGLLPLLLIVRPLVGPTAAPTLYWLAGLMLVDRFRAELAMVPLADQAILMLEMLAAIAGLALLLGSGRLNRPLAGERSAAKGLASRRAIAMFALVFCAVSLAAAAYGAMRLARILGSGFLVSVFAALTLYAAVQVMDGLLAFALRVWPLRSLGMVAKHRELLAGRAHRLLRWLAVGTWLLVSLMNVGLLDPVLTLGRTVLEAELRRGAISISLGDVFVFVFTVWLAFALSAFIRFVLEEDVYPRMRLSRGLPYVVSSVLHYIILFLGFLLAVSALGLDLTKVTILAGAFGVGLGLGLQGLVNNFVSGLIVLFERPIHLGDVIKMGDVTGKVRRIGIRSTTVLTSDGAEVIVPNAHMIAEKVTNWTHSGQLRRLDVRVGVAYGSSPEKVLELLRGVATSHPAVVIKPAPLALLLGFGDSALNFELRAWTNRSDQWDLIRSELSIAIYAALRNAGMEIPFDQGFQRRLNPDE